MPILRWSKNLKKLVRNHRIIIANRNTGNWLKLSKECFDILEEAMENKLSEDELLCIIVDEKDKIYFRELISKIKELELFDNTDTDNSELNQVYFLITNRCNLNCIHCSMNASQSKTDEYLDTNKIIYVLEQIIKMNPKQIVLSGGEPLIRKDFLEILTYLRNRFKGHITLMTNGVLINEGNINDIVNNIDSIDLSIDGVDEESCSVIRGKGVFAKVINTINLLHKIDFDKISLSMVFGNRNYHILSDFYKLNCKYGTKPIPRAFSPIGRGKINADVFNQIFESNTKQVNFETLRDTLKACNCKACKKEICVDYKGDIYPCALLVKPQYFLGSMLNIQNIQDVLDYSRQENLSGYKEFLKLYPDKIEKCEKCDVNLFCWSCLHFSDIYKDSDEFNERCNEKKEALNKLIWDIE